MGDTEGRAAESDSTDDTQAVSYVAQIVGATLMRLIKTEADMLHDLHNSVRLIEVSAKSFFETFDDIYLLAILSQIRALVCFKEGGRSQSMRPLLIEQSEETGNSLKIFSRPSKDNQVPNDLVASIVAGKTWAVAPQPGFVQLSVREWMLANTYFDDGSRTYKSRNEIARALSEKRAVHYDNDVASVVESLGRSTGSRMDGVQFFIIDTACAVVYLSRRYLAIRQHQTLGEPADIDKVLANIDADFGKIQISMV